MSVKNKMLIQKRFPMSKERREIIIKHASLIRKRGKSTMENIMDGENQYTDSIKAADALKELRNGSMGASKNIQTIANKYIRSESEDEIEKDFRKIMKSQGYERF
jgi:hypothetical protein